MKLKLSVCQRCLDMRVGATQYALRNPLFRGGNYDRR